MIALGWLAAAQAAAVADHRGVVDEDAIEWHTAIDTRHQDVTFVTPVPREDVLDVSGGTLKLVDGAVVGITNVKRTVHLGVRQPDRTPLRPPLVADTVQQVWVDGHRFDAASSLGLVTRVGWTGDAELRSRDRRAAKHALGAIGCDLEVGGLLLQGRPNQAVLPGSLRPKGGYRAGGAALAVAATLLTLLGLFGANRWLERSARRERLEAYLAAMGAETD